MNKIKKMPEGYKKYMALIQQIPKEHLKEILFKEISNMDKTAHKVNMLSDELKRRSET